MTRKSKFRIGAGAFAIAVIAGAIAFILIRPLYECLSDFGEAIKSQNFAVAYSLTTPQFRQAMPLSQFVEQQISVQQRCGRLNKLKAGGCEVAKSANGWRGKCETNLLFEHGIEHLWFFLSKSGGDWRIFAYRPKDGDIE